MKEVLIIEKSTNIKTGPVSATYAPISTCSKKCPLLNNGCYAQNGWCGIHVSKINKNAKNTSRLNLARAEAQGIHTLTGKRDLRLHVSGDCTTSQSTKVVSAACEGYMNKEGKKKVWTYTHSWEDVPREDWGKVSVLASCETINQCKDAMRRGYAASLLYNKSFKGKKEIDGIKLRMCKALISDTDCVRCRLCMNDKRLLKNNEVICFTPHGSKKDLAMSILKGE